MDVSYAVSLYKDSLTDHSIQGWLSFLEVL